MGVYRYHAWMIVNGVIEEGVEEIILARSIRQATRKAWLAALRHLDAYDKEETYAIRMDYVRFEGGKGANIDIVA